MARLQIRITNIAWRNGRPRFVPGPVLRKIGFRGEDLKRDDGGWMSTDEALAWSQAKDVEIAARRKEAAIAAAAGKRLRQFSSAGRRLFSTEDLIEAWFREDPRMRLVKPGTAEEADIGKRQVKRLAPASIKSYRHFNKLLGLFDGHLYTAPIEALTKPIVYDLYERLWEQRGLANARATIAMLSAAISWGMKKGKVRFHVNPCSELGMTALPPRVRCWTPTEIATMVATADRMDRPEIGDAVILGCWTGQRQTERLSLIDIGLQDGRRIFRQAKTKAIVAIPQSPMVDARLEAARARRQDWPVAPMTIVVDERTRRPFKADWYRHVFMEVRAEAAKACASIASATDQDLRDTAVTWLARAGCTLFEICAITGHSHVSAAQILKHYLASHPEMADNAIAKLVRWFEGQAT